VIVGIKPAKISELIPNKTYLMYSRLHTGADYLKPYLKTILDKKICVIDYERIRNDKD
jgi:hypothetical protein